MDDSRGAVGGMRAVTMAREYGSGGGEIAARLARRLGWSLVDHDVVARVALHMGVTEAEARQRDEHVEGIASRILAAFGAVPTGWGTIAPPPPEGPTEEAYHEAVHRVIAAAANAGPAVIVGRGGQVVLRDRPDVLHVGVVAPPERRLAYVVRREGLDEERARALMQRKDADRAAYILQRYQQKADDPRLYDLIVNTGVIDLDGAVSLIASALERKASKLGLSPGELGPGVGIAPYPGH